MTAILCCIVIGVTLYLCVRQVCETILKAHKPAYVTDELSDIQTTLDDESQKEVLPTFDDVLRNVNSMLGGDDDE